MSIGHHWPRLVSGLGAFAVTREQFQMKTFRPCLVLEYLLSLQKVITRR